MANLGLEIVMRTDLPALVARWQREISAVELQAGYQAILAVADANGCGRWLLDLRRREELATAEIDAWMQTVFLPQLQGRYSTRPRLAFLVSPLRASHEASSVAKAIKTSSATSHESAVFTNEADAYRWLAQ